MTTLLKRILQSLIVIALQPIDSNAQIAFSKTYGGAYEEDGRWMEQLPDSGYILTGNTATYSNFASDIWLVRTDLYGNQLWTRSYDGNLAYDFANCVKPTADGGFIIAGFTSDTSGSYDGYVIRTDGNGNVIWQRKTGGSGLQEFEAIIQTSDGNFTAVGIDYGPGTGYYDLLLTRFDDAGNILWSRTFGGASYEIGNSLQQTTDGGYVVAGQSYSYQLDSTYSGDYILYKLDSAGNITWRKNYSRVDLQECHYVQNTPDGGYVLVGDADGLSNSLGQTDIWMIKTDASGNILWEKVLGGTKKDGGKTVEPTTDGGFIVGGISRSFGLSEPNFYLAKLDGAGNLEWQTYSYGTPQHDHLYRARECSDGGFAMFGYFRNTSGDKNFALVKVGLDGGISNDVGIDRFTSPSDKLCRNFGVGISVQLTNFGQRNLYEIPVTVVIQDSSSSIILQDTLHGSLAPSQSRELTFNETFDFLRSGTYELAAFIPHLFSDVSYSNDSSFLSIEVNTLPQPPTTIPSIRCSSGELVLNAQAQEVEDSLFWFDEPSGGNLVNWGASFQTGTLNVTDTFWVESNRGAGGTCGPIDNSIGNGLYSSGGGIRFDARQPFTIISVKVLAQNAGVRIVQLRDGSGTVLQSRSFNLAAGWQRIYLDFQVPEALDLELVLDASSAPLYRNLTGVAYPYKVSGVLEMFEGWPTANRYYYFYDWNVFIPDQECSSSRIPAYAIIGTDSSSVFDRIACDSGAVSFQVNSPEPINWYDTSNTLLGSDNNFTTPILFAPATFLLEVGTCPNRIPVQALIIPRSSDPLTSGAVLCGPGQATLEAISNETVRWYDEPSGGNLFSTGSQFLTPFLDTTTTYFAIAGDACPSAAVPATVNVITSSPPQVNDVRACAPASVTLTANSTDTVYWYVQLLGGTPFHSGNSITTPLLGAPATYYVEASNGCASVRVPVTADIVTVQPPLTNDASRCGAGPVVLTANSLSNITWWSDSTGGVSLGTGIAYTTDTLYASTAFFAQADDGTCFSTRIRSDAFLSIVPAPVASGDNRCGIGPVTLQALSNDTVTWFDAPAGGTAISNGIVFQPFISSDTVFWVEAGIGCTSIRVPVNANLNPPADPPRTGVISVCAPDSTTLTATPSVPSEPIHWYEMPGGTEVGTGTSIEILVPDYGVAYDTMFYAAAGSPGCESSSVPLTIHVLPRPAGAVVTGAERCGPGSVNLQANSPYPMTWYDVQGNIVNNGSAFSPYVVATTEYFIGAFDGTCMSMQTSVSAVVNPLPVISINGPDTLVLTSGQSTNLGTTVTDGTGPYSYVWSPAGQTTASIFVFSPATYSVTVTDSKGCTGIDQVMVTVLTQLQGHSAFNPFLTYPNPTSGLLYLSGPTGIEVRLLLSDVTGKIVEDRPIMIGNEGYIALDLSSLPVGIMTLRLETNEGAWVQKVIIR